MEEYLEAGNLAKLLSYLTSLPPPRLAPLLTQPIKELPLLHHLAGFTFHPEDAPLLTALLTLLTSHGYNLDLKTDHYSARKRASPGFTALLAAVETSNLMLVTSLISAGASPTVRDGRGFTAYHWAVIVGNLKVLKSLLQNSPTPLPSTDKEVEGEDDVHPLLHTAVDEGRTEMVFFLIENGFVDPNELATYKGVLSEQALSQFPSRYNSDSATLQIVDTPFTPLGRAVRMRKIPIIDLLLKSPNVKVSFKELHFCIMEGDTEVACLLIPSFFEEDLAKDKIMNKWALHCLHPKAFQDELRLEFTVQLVCDYLDAGWDINAVTEEDPFQLLHLLHLACLYRADIRLIQYLVECGADVNMSSKSKNGSQMTPLQYSISLWQWDSAIFLMDHGADPMISGCKRQGSEKCLMGVSEEKGGEDFRGSPQLRHFNSLELLLRVSSAAGLPTLKHMLTTKDIVWQGASEFRRAMERDIPSFVVTVLQHCDAISVPDLTWARTSAGAVMPTLLFHLEAVRTSPCHDLDSLATLLRLMVTLGYNFSLTTENAPLDKTAFPEASYNIVHNSAVIFPLLEIDFQAGSNQLLETLLEVAHVTLNIPNRWSQNPVEFVLHLWNERCLEEKRCWKVTQGSCWETVKLLLNHGVDCSRVVIGESFRYHWGYLPLVKGLYYAGAKFTPDFLTREGDISCHPGYSATKAFPEEIQALEKWKKEFDRKNGGSLKRACILQIRKMLETVGHLKILEVLPGTLKDEVLLLKESCLVVN